MIVIASIAIVMCFLVFLALWNLHEDLKKIELKMIENRDAISTAQSCISSGASNISNAISHLGNNMDAIYESMFTNAEVMIKRTGGKE